MKPPKDMTEEELDAAMVAATRERARANAAYSHHAAERDLALRHGSDAEHLVRALQDEMERRYTPPPGGAK